MTLLIIYLKELVPLHFIEITYFKVIPDEEHFIKKDNFILMLLDHCFQSAICGVYSYVIVSQALMKNNL